MEVETQQAISKLNKSSDTEDGFDSTWAELVWREYTYIFPRFPPPQPPLGCFRGLFWLCWVGLAYLDVGRGEGKPFWKKNGQKKECEGEFYCVFQSGKWELRMGGMGEVM